LRRFACCDECDDCFAADAFDDAVRELLIGVPLNTPTSVAMS
jgi:hypothetical protein